MAYRRNHLGAACSLCSGLLPAAFETAAEAEPRDIRCRGGNTALPGFGTGRRAREDPLDHVDRDAIKLGYLCLCHSVSGQSTHTPYLGRGHGTAPARCCRRSRRRLRLGRRCGFSGRGQPRRDRENSGLPFGFLLSRHGVVSDRLRRVAVVALSHRLKQSFSGLASPVYLVMICPLVGFVPFRHQAPLQSKIVNNSHGYRSDGSGCKPRKPSVLRQMKRFNRLQEPVASFGTDPMARCFDARDPRLREQPDGAGSCLLLEPSMPRGHRGSVS